MVTLREMTDEAEELRAETGEVRPWRYDKLESESILVDKVVPAPR